MDCSSNEDCTYFWECIDVDGNMKCEREPLWPPNAVDIIALLMIPIVIGVGNVGGSGKKKKFFELKIQGAVFLRCL